MKFLRQDIRKYNWTCLDRKIQNQIDHILIDGTGHSSILDVQSFKGGNCDTDHCLVVAKVRKKLAVSKQAAQKLDVEMLISGS
jgi:hypothetical protein